MNKTTRNAVDYLLHRINGKFIIKNIVAALTCFHFCVSMQKPIFVWMTISQMNKAGVIRSFPDVLSSSQLQEL